jgi:hypothetical protein
VVLLLLCLMLLLGLVLLDLLLVLLLVLLGVRVVHLLLRRLALWRRHGFGVAEAHNHKTQRKKVMIRRTGKDKGSGRR